MDTKTVRMCFIVWCIFALLLNNKATASSSWIDDVILKFIVDATSMPILFPPLRISVHLCISHDDTIRLSRKMSSHGLMHGIYNFNNDFDQRIYNNLEHLNLYMLDLDCDYATAILQQAHSKKMFVGPTKWLLLQDRRTVIDNNGNNLTSTYNDTILEMFENLAVYPDSDVLLARRLDGDFLELLSVYRPSPQRGVVWENRGNWTIDNGLQMRTFEVASARRKNLQQTVLKSCLAFMDPNSINHLEDFAEIQKDPITKANYRWVNHLAERMNATVTFNITYNWGQPDKNGNWNGLSGMLQRNDIDISGTGVYMQKNRINIIQYIQLYTRTGEAFIFRKPLLSSVKNILTLPFDQHVWIAIAVFLLLVFCLLYLSMKWEYYEIATKKSTAYSNSLNMNKPTVSDDIFILLGAFYQQGYSYEPYKVSTRIVTLMLLVASLSLYAAYTANIVGLLQSTTDSIKTPADLLNSPLTLAVFEAKHNHYYLKIYNDSVRKAIYEQKILPYGNKSWISLNEGVERIRTETFAFYAPRGPSYYLIQQTYQEEEKCGLSEINYLNMPYPLLGLPKQSPYLEIIKYGALKLREYGLKYRDEYRLYPKRPTCASNTNYITIGFTECYFALVSMGYGMMLSIIMLVLELLWHKRKNMDITKKTFVRKKPVLKKTDFDYVE